MGARSLVLAQFCLAVYGGYFGGAVGIFMIALWSAGTEMSIAASNPMRITQLGAIYAGAAVVLLNGSGALAAPLYLVAMLLGAVVGGWAGAQLARRLPGRLLHAILLVTAATTTILYFIQA